jgi:TonB-linked SusC/RagA family outer membrane protein
MRAARRNVMRKTACGMIVAFLSLGNIMYADDAVAPLVQQQGKRITGTVLDEKGEPVIGANVMEKGTSNGTITDIDGKFSITVPQNARLLVSYIGYATQEVGTGSQSPVTVRLVEDTRALGEVVVLGYGAQARKADLSASIGTVEHLDIVKNRPVMNGVGGMLQGQIPGVTIRNDGGDPSKELQINIRGTGSNAASEKALIVVDGVPNGNYIIDEIESVVVLKDAASAAIYGAQSGSAGVILITTKKAKAGKTSISYDGNYGFSNATNLPQSLTIEQQRKLREYSYGEVGQSVPAGWDLSKNPYISETRTDWMDVIFRTGTYQRHTIALSGGTEDFSNRLSLNYDRNEGTLLGSFNEQYQLRYNADYKLSNYIKIREDAYISTSSSRGADTNDAYNGVILRALYFPRSAVPYYSDGTFGGTAPKDPAYAEQYGSNYADIFGDIQNPLRGLVSDRQIKRPLRFRSNTFLEVSNIVPGLRFTSRFTYYLAHNWEKTFIPRIPEPGKPNNDNSLRYNASREVNWESENTFNYDNSFGKHTVGALLSTVAQENTSAGFEASARGFNLETENLTYFGSASNYPNPADATGIDRNISFIGRASYSYDNRYFLTASFRRDYAGRLPVGKKYGDFPGVTAAWKLSEEPFMPEINGVNLIKLRGSWGLVGNIGSIAWMGQRSGPGIGFWRLSGRGGPFGIDNPYIGYSVNIPGAYNANLTWETSEQTDGGIDIELLGNRLSLSADYFHKRTYNLIQDQPIGLPSYAGVNAPKVNSGEITNTGIEVSAGWNDKVGSINYFISGNLATLTNTITDIGEINPQTGKKNDWRWNDSFRATHAPFRSREGDPMYTFWVIKTDGIFQTDAEAEKYVDKNGNRIQPNAKAGDLKFIDQDGDGKIGDEDRVYMGNYFPDLTYALTAGATWKNFTFSFMLQGVQGVDIYNASKFTLLNESTGSFNRWDRILDAWPATNDIPRISLTDPNQNFRTNSDWYIEDGSYLRIKNISLSYDANALIRKAACFNDRKSSLFLTLGVDNLHTFTKYTGMDPEVGGKGMDGGSYPVPRTVSLSVKLTY